MFDHKQPEDIFSDTDHAEGAQKASAPAAPSGGLVQPIVPPPSRVPPQKIAPTAPVVPPPSHGGGHGLRTVIIVLLAFAAIGTAAYLTYAFMVKPPQASVVQNTPDTTTPTQTSTQEPSSSDSPSTNTDLPLQTEDRSSFLDSDGDGLTNAEELEYGTSVSKPDTDSDGLGDREEVKVYGTDPRRADTDGDGYLDGQEVQNGFNPNGDGRLLEIPAQTPGM